MTESGNGRYSVLIIHPKNSATVLFDNGTVFYGNRLVLIRCINMLVVFLFSEMLNPDIITGKRQ